MRPKGFTRRRRRRRGPRSQEACIRRFNHIRDGVSTPSVFPLCLGVAIRVNPNLYHSLFIVVSPYFVVIFVDIFRTQLNYKHDY